MAETCEITLTEENWKKIDALLERIPDSDFLRFCVMNDIVERGLESLERRMLIMNQQAIYEQDWNSIVVT